LTQEFGCKNINLIV